MKKQLLTLMFALGITGLKAQNPYPVLTVDSVQYVNPTKLANVAANTTPDYKDPVLKNPTFGDTVRFDAIVLTNPKIYGLSQNRKAAYVQQKGGGPFSGVLVMCDHAAYPGKTLAQLITETKFYENMVPGYEVRITGVMREFSGETQINLLPNNVNWDNSVEQLSLTPDTFSYKEITADKLMTGNPNTGWVRQKTTAEELEGSPVILRNVTVYSVTANGANRNNWSVIDDKGNVIEIRDFSGYYRRDDNEDTVPKIANTFQPPAIGTRLDYLRGIVTEYITAGANAVPRYGIAPIYPDDYKVCTSCPPLVKYIQRSPMVATVADSVAVTCEITVGDTTLKNRFFHYRLPGSTTIDSVAMTPRPSYPNQFIGKAPAAGMSGVLNYWVSAEDNKNRRTFYPDPLTIGVPVYITANGVNRIADLQYSNNSNLATIWDGDSLPNINVKAVVTTNDALGNLISVQDGNGPNTGIFVHRSSFYGTDTLKAGDSILISRAVVRENFNVTTLYSVGYTLLNRDNALPAFETTLAIDSFINNRVAYARPYEGMLVKFDSVKVVSQNPDAPGEFGEFSVYPKNIPATTGLRIDDLSANFKGYNSLVNVNQIAAFAQGVMYFANSNFKLLPRNEFDFDMSGLDSVAPILTVIGNNPDTINRYSHPYVDPGATAIDDKDGDITANIIVTGSVDTATVGTYTLTYTVTDMQGNMATADRIVVVKDSILDTEAPVITIQGNNPDTVELSADTYTDPGFTATDNIEGDLTNKVAITGSVNRTVIGTYILKYNVSDLSGNAATEKIRTVIVKDTVEVGLTKNNVLKANIQLYPNPAHTSISLNLSEVKTQPFTLTIVDVLGKTLLTKTYTQQTSTDKVDVSTLQNGIYFCTISNTDGQQTIRFVVNSK